LGQPRIWMSMSRDGLLPPVFSRIHPKFKTPSFSTILTGFLVGVPALFMNLQEVVDLCSVGTLFAFVLVCGGILRLQNAPGKPESRFKTPYINGKWILPVLFVVTVIGFTQLYEGGITGFFTIDDNAPAGWAGIRDKIPYILFAIVFLVLTILTFIRNYSLIPTLGFLSCSYLLCESGATNWERFILWLFIGLLVYFLYGYRNSKIRKRLEAAGNRD
ncbi:MAG: amino acid transporter, partial [Sphingobacteriales bacterium]